jgi:hypothetical protein
MTGQAPSMRLNSSQHPTAPRSRSPRRVSGKSRCAALLGGTLLRERGDSTVGSTGGKSSPAHVG